MTVAQNAALGLRFAGRTSEIGQRVPALLELVGLTAFADRNVQGFVGRAATNGSHLPPFAGDTTRPVCYWMSHFSALDAFTRRAPATGCAPHCQGTWAYGGAGHA